MTLSETQIIDRLAAAAGAARDDVVVGIGDDGAVLAPPPGTHLVAAVDTLVKGRHFPVDLAPDDLGHRALAVNLSDLAAMGATPAWALVSLALERPEADWIDAFATGLATLAARHDVAIVGGDTVAGPLAVTIQVLGYVRPGAELRRSGARPGDILYVSGTPGDAAAGFAIRRGDLAAEPGAANRLWQRFSRPEPRVALGVALAGRVTAAIDVSDGIVTDAGRLAAASGCGIEIDADRLPLSGALAAATDRTAGESLALAGGDDYELLVAAPPDAGNALAEIALAAGSPLSPIGRVVAGAGVTCLRGGRPFEPPQPFSHFPGAR